MSIIEKTCIIGRDFPICDTCKYGYKITRGKFKGWYCNDYIHNFTCGNKACRFDGSKKCEVCGFEHWNIHVFAAHMSELHGQEE